MNFKDQVHNTIPGKGEAALFWLGQAGFLVKNSAGELMAVDPYFSDMAERLDGNKRLMPPLMEPEELNADLLLATHYHCDHLDLDSLPAMMACGTRLFCCPQSAKEALKADIRPEQMQVMPCKTAADYLGFHIESVFADHGDAAPEAVGFIVETEGIRIYFSGDTSYQAKRMRDAAEREIDILIVPINGEYGNMNERDAAMLAAQTKARLTIPSHFWLFSRHMGSPYAFELEMKANAPDCPEYTMCQGEKIIFSKSNGLKI